MIWKVITTTCLLLSLLYLNCQIHLYLHLDEKHTGLMWNKVNALHHHVISCLTLDKLSGKAFLEVDYARKSDVMERRDVRGSGAEGRRNKPSLVLTTSASMHVKGSKRKIPNPPNVSCWLLRGCGSGHVTGCSSWWAGGSLCHQRLHVQMNDWMLAAFVKHFSTVH